MGEFVPVFRLSCRRWSFGKVLTFRSIARERQFCLLFGTSGTDSEWVNVRTKPFDSYVRYYRRGEATPVAGFAAEAHVIIEPAYDDSPIPLTNRRTLSQLYRVSIRIPFSPVQTSTPAPQSVHDNDNPTGAGTFPSSWTTPYYQHNYVPPDRYRNDIQEADTGSQPSLRLWTIDVSHCGISIQYCTREWQSLYLLLDRCLMKRAGGPSIA